MKTMDSTKIMAVANFRAEFTAPACEWMESGFDCANFWETAHVIYGCVPIPHYVPQRNWARYAVRGVEVQVKREYTKLQLIIMKL